MKYIDMQKTIIELINIEKQDVLIHTEHKLYGEQIIECALNLINDTERLGFSVKDQEIYINKKDICAFGIEKEIYYFADALMRIEIRKLN